MLSETSIRYLGVLKGLPQINYLRSCPYPRPIQALLSIRPEYVTSIISGEKRFEFRRSIFRRPVSVVVIYVTAPVQRVIGEFDVKSILYDCTTALWKTTCKSSGISEDGFFRYFDGLPRGYAIEIGEVRLYEEPLRLDDHFGIRAPQSFMYLDFSWPRTSTHS